MPAPFPRLGPKRPLSDLEKEMDIAYVEDTCGWCGAHLIEPQQPMYDGQLICLNACHLSAGDFLIMQAGIMEAYRRVEERNKLGE